MHMDAHVVRGVLVLPWRSDVWNVERFQGMQEGELKWLN